MENEFTVKNKPITFKVSIAFMVASVALALMMILLVVACRIYEKDKFIWFIEVVPACSLAGSILGLYIFYKEEFSFKEGVFKYIRVFKKDVAINAATIDYVYMHPIGQRTKIEFMNKKGEITDMILDDGTILQDGIFLNALEKLQIKVIRNGYGDE
ncbi:MAG: hypothetical protein K2K38_01560 [Clostridia bacterium]|nr:hypothetical protein [Clostridia bacterium]